ncbi:hypothetical protein ACFPM3_25870 [Streptomyces coeruleoprunus]|uniref:DUF779 domain-containing protein n=1 Tax=Streptomyces coeruleoprunus TaxID=285563 RepID=A0ABV9XN06_9ACTN
MAVRPLPDDVARALDLLLEDGDSLREQVPHFRVLSRCTCGCGTADFGIDTDAVGPSPTAPSRTGVVAEAVICTETGDCPGEVLLFARAGYLAWLEVCSWSDDDVTLADFLRGATRDLS